MNWISEALIKFKKGQELHLIENEGLLEKGLIQYADHPKEIVITEAGMFLLEQISAVDSKRS